MRCFNCGTIGFVCHNINESWLFTTFLLNFHSFFKLLFRRARHVLSLSRSVWLAAGVSGGDVAVSLWGFQSKSSAGCIIPKCWSRVQNVLNLGCGGSRLQSSICLAALIFWLWSRQNCV